MSNYWIRHRLIWTLVLCVATALIASVLFVFPYIIQRASCYNLQSVYKNTCIDFIVPEPSFDQVNNLPGTNGIDRIFPFFVTKTQVEVNGKSRKTTLLLSDQFQNIDITMYNDKRLIDKSNIAFDNQIFADWQLCHDTGAKIGDTVSFAVGGVNKKFTISAVYETNSIYDSGALLVYISKEQVETIKRNSHNNGYSCMYVSASDYNLCRKYLTTEYRPLGRLKNRESFDDEDQYQIHYNALMSSGYANEITDFRVKKTASTGDVNHSLIWIGAIIIALVIITFNYFMSKRGCERGYFLGSCIHKGINVRPYYIISLISECFLFLSLYVVFLSLAVVFSKIYLSRSSYDAWITLIPAVVVIAETICYFMNCSVVSFKIVKLDAVASQNAARSSLINYFHVNTARLLVFIITFSLVLSLLCVFIDLSIRPYLVQLNSLFSSKYLYSVIADREPQAEETDVYYNLDAGIGFALAPGCETLLNADVVMQSATARYSDSLPWSTDKLSSDEIAISKGLAMRNRLVSGDMLYSRHIVDGVVHKYTIRTILPDVQSTRIAKSTDCCDGIIVVGNDPLYTDNISHKFLLFTNQSIEKLSDSIPTNLIYRSDEIKCVVKTVAPFFSLLVLLILVITVCAAFFLKRTIACNFKRLLTIGFDSSRLDKSYDLFVLGACVVLIVLSAVLTITLLRIGCINRAEVVLVLCVIIVECATLFISASLFKNQLWRQ